MREKEREKKEREGAMIPFYQRSNIRQSSMPREKSIMHQKHQTHSPHFKFHIANHEYRNVFIMSALMLSILMPINKTTHINSEADGSFQCYSRKAILMILFKNTECHRRAMTVHGSFHETDRCPFMYSKKVLKICPVIHKIWQPGFWRKIHETKK